jgi:hypothetical protein
LKVLPGWQTDEGAISLYFARQALLPAKASSQQSARDSVLTNIALSHSEYA